MQRRLRIGTSDEQYEWRFNKSTYIQYAEESRQSIRCYGFSPMNAPPKTTWSQRGHGTKKLLSRITHRLLNLRLGLSVTQLRRVLTCRIKLSLFFKGRGIQSLAYELGVVTAVTDTASSLCHEYTDKHPFCGTRNRYSRRACVHSASTAARRTSSGDSAGSLATVVCTAMATATSFPDPKADRSRHLRFLQM